MHCLQKLISDLSLLYPGASVSFLHNWSFFLPLLSLIIYSSRFNLHIILLFLSNKGSWERKKNFVVLLSKASADQSEISNFSVDLSGSSHSWRKSTPQGSISTLSYSFFQTKAPGDEKLCCLAVKSLCWSIWNLKFFCWSILKQFMHITLCIKVGLQLFRDLKMKPLEAKKFCNLQLCSKGW